MTPNDSSDAAGTGPMAGPVLVTGTSGFIGRHLLRLLVANGWNAVGLDRRPAAVPTVPHYTCDILDGQRLNAVFDEVRPTAVIHLAARTDLDEREHLSGYAANIAGVENLASAIRGTASVRRAICTSSQLVCPVGYQPQSAEDYCPTTLYGESKVLTEQIWRKNDGGGVDWLITRPTTIWGPDMNPHYLRFFSMIRKGRYFHVGNEDILKSYGYVGNSALQYVRLLSAPAELVHRKTFYIADYQPIGLRSWATEFQAELGAPPIRTVPRWIASAAASAGDILNRFGMESFPFNSFRLNNVLTSYRVDMSETETACGPVPYDVHAGVVQTVGWLKNVWRNG